MKRKLNIERIAVVLGTMSALGILAALISAAVGSYIAATTCVIVTSVAGLLAGVLESIRLTK